MNVDLEAIRSLVRNASPGSTLVMAPDVYEALASGRDLEKEAMGVTGRHSIQIQRSTALKPGTAMIMAATHIAPPQDWACNFLSKSGPAKSSVKLHVGIVMPTLDPEPPPPPQPTSRPQPRQRIVDT